MSTIELKEQLISRIQITNDDSILEGLLQLLEFESNKVEPYKFNAEQLNRIHEAQAQFARGEYYTEEEADEITKKWLEG